ncbi:SEC10/PgrA surface exclusion domain-containing protein [Limosilactobacillus reuteri]|uniref:SEC10/PgrA surface exclusion domain-containing protein n=1 Tax=Limosilactobacillus reuteri TaxID=1598 RepID=UPI001E51B2EB|nr:SEC10/PgrA surface exclusion domain-containing protein [Limosilactobacillus reuteri]MCC4384080.1 SEC10/PgrA surface exclusion domain-containing protein [Limosilactobacillus reuteri]MCC4420771.1 SEC10/PgrA surface exclusion domain-containing protein [Limosilactobacillus reuteri]
MSMKKGSYKILKSVALAGALTATGAVATTAHADTTKASAPVQGVASTDQQLTNLKSQQTANESAVASSNAATMSAATTSANSQIADLNNQIKERQASDAAVQQASQASAIAQVNSEATSATSAENASYSQAVASQTAANNVALKSAQAIIVTEQQKNQETAQENTDFQKQTSNLDSQHKAMLNKLDQDLQNDTNNTNDAIQKEVARQKADQQGAIDKTAKDFDNQIKDASQAVDQVQKTVNDDQNTINEKKKNNDAAQQAVKNAKDSLSKDQNDLSVSQKALQDSNVETTDTLKVPQDYINVWKEFSENHYGWELTKEAHPELWQRNHDACTEAKKLNNYVYYVNDPLFGDYTTFHISEIDKNTPVHFNSDGTLSRDDVIIATQYAAELINPIREAIGINPYRITNASIDMNMENASKYRAKGHNDLQDGHDGDLMKQIAKEWGTDALSESLASNAFLADKVISGQKVTVADLKVAVYQAVVGLLFEGADGSDNGHTTDLLGVRFSKDNDRAKEHNIHGSITLGGSDLLGVTYDIDPVNRNGWVRFNSIVDGKSPRIQQEQGYGIKAGSAADKTIQGSNYDQIAIPTPGDATKKLQDQIKKLQDKINTDKQAVIDAQSKANTTDSELKSAQDKFTQDSAKLSQAQAHVNDLKANKDQTLKAMATDPMQSPAVKKFQNKLTDIKQQHDTAVKAENDQYIAKVSDLKAKHEAKLAEIAAQPTSLAELQSQLQAKLDTLKANHDAKLKQITDDANAKIAAIKNQKVNDPEIDKLNAQIDQIKSDLAKKQQELDNQYQALKIKDEAEYNTLANKLHSNTQVMANGSTQQVFTSRSGKVAYVVPSQQSIATNSVKTGLKQINSTSDSNELLSKESNNDTNRLPQTGNNSSLAMVLLGAAAAMFGFGLVGKKRMY